MEIKEHQPQIDYLQQFKDLPNNYHMKIPLSMLTPIGGDDFTSSKTDESKESIVVFYKEKNNTLFIDDGNHRYFRKIDEISKAQNNYKDPDLSNEMIFVQKIDPKEAENSWILEI
jgi:hypothetical protein